MAMLTRQYGGNLGTKLIHPMIVAVGYLFVAACGSLPSISTEVNYCCRPAAERVQSYRIEFNDMPEFLKPMLRDEASIVLASKGLDYTEGDADAILTMSYIDTPLSTNTTDDGEAGRPAEDGVTLRFVAEVRVEMKLSVAQEIVSSGSISRIHNVTEGVYMHEAPARDALRMAFADLFMDYPNPVLDEI